MSGHESHGHGGHEDHGHGHGDHGHGHEKKAPKPITDELTYEIGSNLHKNESIEKLKETIASGKLNASLEKEALKMIEQENRNIYINKLARDRVIRYVKNTKKSYEVINKKIDKLEDAIQEHGESGRLYDLMKKQLKEAEKEKIKLEEIIEENKENILDMEAEKNLDETRSAYAKEYKKQYGNAKKERRIENIKIGLFNAGRFVKNQFRKEEYKKDFLEKKKDSDFISPELESKKTEYDVARLALANRMYERREAELLLFAEKNNVDPLEIKRRLAEYRTKDIIQKTFLDEKIKFRKESGIPEHGVVLRVLHWYGNQPRWKKIALSTALFTAGGAAGVLPFAAGAIAKYGIISYTGMRFGASALTGGIVANGVKIIDVINKEKDDKFKEDQKTFKEKQDKKFVNEEINQIQYEKQLERLDRKENTKLKKRMLVKSGVGVLIGAGTGALVYNTIYDNIRFQDMDNPVPPTTKGIHITKEPEKIIQINPENPQIKTPEIKTQPHTIIQMIPDDYEPRPSITTDKDIHITAEETNIEQVSPENINDSPNIEHENPRIINQVNPEDHTPKIQESSDPKIEQVNPEGENHQNQAPEITNTQPEVGGSGQTAFEYRESLIKQSATSMEHFKNTSGLSDSAIKQMLTPSDKNHTRIIIEKSSRDLATAQKMIDYDLRNIKAVSEDYKHVIERKVYNDGSGYHIYEVIEFKK